MKNSNPCKSLSFMQRETRAQILSLSCNSVREITQHCKSIKLQYNVEKKEGYFVEGSQRSDQAGLCGIGKSK